MFWMCIRIASVTTYDFMEKYRKFSLFIILIPTPDFTPFLLYSRWKSGVTFVRRCFRDDIILSVGVKKNLIHSLTHLLSVNVISKVKPVHLFAVYKVIFTLYDFY